MSYRIQTPPQPPDGDKPVALLARYVYTTPPELIRARDFPIDVRTLRLADDKEDDQDDELYLIPTAMILLQWSAARAGKHSIVYSLADVHGMEVAIRLEMAIDTLHEDGILSSATLFEPDDAQLSAQLAAGASLTPLGTAVYAWVKAITRQ